MRQDEDLNDPHGLNGLSSYLKEFKKELFKLKSYLVKTNKEGKILIYWAPTTDPCS